MLHRLFQVVTRSWPAGVIALPFGAVCFLLLTRMPDSIEAYDAMRDVTGNSQYGGIEVLFMVNAAALGWINGAILQRRLGQMGLVLLLTSSFWCLVSIGGGFAFAYQSLGNLTGPMWEMFAFSLGSAGVATVVQSYWGDLF